MRHNALPLTRSSTPIKGSLRSPIWRPAPQLRHLLPITQSRNLAQVRSDIGIRSDTWFTPSTSHGQTLQHKNSSEGDEPRVDERTLKLGKTLRILQSRLPTLLASPLPQDVLSPHITLHLFPSTHPHLPKVSGRVPYHAALWTAPVAWGRVPIVGNVKLIVLSERVVKNGPSSCTPTTTTPNGANVQTERLIVRWKTSGKTQGKGMGALYRGIGGNEQVDKITEWLGGDVRDDQEFCGLFIFEFDEEGRILTHTIEHAEESGYWERTSRVVTVTEWLLSRVNGKGKEPELALSYVRHRDDRVKGGMERG